MTRATQIFKTEQCFAKNELRKTGEELEQNLRMYSFATHTSSV